MRSNLQPLGMLVEHRIHNVDKGLVTIEKSVTSGQQIAFQPTFTLMLAQYLHHAPFACKKLVTRYCRRFPLPVGRFKHRFQTIGDGLVGTKHAEITPIEILYGYIAYKTP